MRYGETNRKHGRIAATILTVILLGAAAIAYLGYTAAFTPTEKVTVMSPRAGLVMERDAKVKYRGIQIGTVSDIAYDGREAKLTLAIKRNELPFVPSNAPVQISGNTIFGAKSVEFMPPESPEGPLQPGAVVRAESVQLEVNTLFQKLTEVLHKVDPISLNGTLSALAEGLRGHGDDLGVTLAGLNSYLGQLNPKLPTLQDDFAKAATVADIYGDAAPNLVRILDNAPALSNTIVDQQDNLNATLLATTGLANNGYETLAPAAEDYVAAMQRLRAPAKVLGEYSPEFGCMLQSLVDAAAKFGPMIGGTRPGLYTSSSFIPGAPSYTYPESLPIVNASGGPNCRGLPNLPSKQFGGSWYRAPFLVTDNAYVPFQPNTEMQVHAPSTLQFLFNGAFAERDDY